MKSGKKDSFSGQGRSQRGKESVGAETGAGGCNKPVSQKIASKRAAKSRLSNEYDFRSIDSSEAEACCYYEFFRESAVMHGSIEDGHWRGGVLPVCEDQNARSTLMFALNKAGWDEATKKNEAPPPWNSLNAETKTEISRCAKRCLQDRSDHPKWRPRFLVQEFLPGHDPVELKSQLEEWREKSCDTALVDRRYFFGLFRLDETCNEKEAVRAFGAFFRKRYGKTKGSKSGRGARWRERLNQLAVMRIRKHARNQWAPRCAFAIQMVRPSESTADTQPQLQPAFLKAFSLRLDLDWWRPLGWSRWGSKSN